MVEVLERPAAPRAAVMKGSWAQHLVLPEGVCEHPIPFKPAMVRASRDGSKTQTRRLVRPFGNDRAFVLIDDGDGLGPRPWRSEDGKTTTVRRGEQGRLKSPYGEAGDRLWIKETWLDLLGTGIEARTGSPDRCAYRSDTPEGSYGDLKRIELGLKWRPSTYMPRWASRVDLEVTRVRIEFLQDISEEDAIAEGIVAQRGGGFGLPDGSHFHATDPRISYWSLFESIHSKAVVERNPALWCVSFRKLRG